MFNADLWSELVWEFSSQLVENSYINKLKKAYNKTT